MTAAAFALLAVLVVVPAAMVVIRAAGARLRRLRDETAMVEADELAALQAMQLRGFAAPGDLVALSPRERRFMTRTVGPRLADDAALPHRIAQRVPMADREVPVGPFHLVCPACGASLGTTGDVAHYVGACPACSRRVATRRRGSRVALTAVGDQSAPRPPRPNA